MSNGKILNKRRTPISYTNDQKRALLAIEEFLDKPYSKSSFFLLIGNAGTGKTTIAENIAFYDDAVMLAPTNAAVQRLKDKFMCSDIPAERFRTIHSALFKPVNKYGKVLKNKNAFSYKGTYIIDEASMIDEYLLKEIIKEAKKSKCKIIFSGDDFQLEPVGKDPKLFEWDKLFPFYGLFINSHKIKLHEVCRNEGDILKIATHLRSASKLEILQPKTTAFKVLNKLSQTCKNDIEENNNYAILVSTNDKRIYYNNLIRQVRFGKNPKRLYDGDKLIAVSNQSYTNGEQFTIQEHEIIKEFQIKLPNKNSYSIHKALLIKHTDTLNNVYEQLTLVVPDLKSPSLYSATIMQLNEHIYTNRDLTFFDTKYRERKWKREINIATYGYAVSVHKSQGNEWNNIYIDATWLSTAWNQNRWMYTAITRAKENVELLNNKYIKLIYG